MMIEKMAKAMCVADGFDPDGLIAYAKAGQAVAKCEWAIYLARARAALTALLEPSGNMVTAAALAALSRTDDQRIYADTFRAMIQAALDEKEVRGGKARN